MGKITFEDKVKINDLPSIPNINKVTDADMNEIKTVVNENDDELQALKPFVLWENPNISASSFPSQQIILDNGNYDYLEIYYYAFDGRRTVQSLKALKGKDFELMTIFSHDGSMYWGSRKVNYINDTTLQFEVCFSAGTGDIRPAITNDWILPIKVLGYKY